MSRLSFSQIPFWENHKRDIFTVIRDALLLLLKEPNLPLIEDSSTQHSLNRHLAKNCFRRAAYQNKLPYHIPIYNGENPPFRDDVERHLRENKKPDFYWRIVDHTADEASCERNFILECKRLGQQSSPNWPLNKNYVEKGICRFLTSPHEYGKGDDACGMIGFVQSMDFDDILAEVNLAISANPESITPLPVPSLGWQAKGTSELEHDLHRPFPVSPFHMHHFWVDLR
jgi:hypothetical protein